MVVVVVVVVARRRRAPPCVDFFIFFCFVYRASQLQRTTKAVRGRLHRGAPSVAFFAVR
jgi:hypothetical protein